MIDIGEACVECRRDTGLGGELYAHRILACTEEFEGYLCADCLTEMEQETLFCRVKIGEPNG